MESLPDKYKTNIDNSVITINKGHVQKTSIVHKDDGLSSEVFFVDQETK